MNVPTDADPANLVLSQEEVRGIDVAAMEALGIPGLLLMENAARGVVARLEQVCESGSVTIVCGPGNNGGDGLAVARQLAAGGHAPHVLLETAGKSLSRDAHSNLEFLSQSGVAVQVCDGPQDCEPLLSSLTSADWIVESLLGTGVRGGLRSPFVEWVQAINGSAARVLAVDVQTGMDCDTGEAFAFCVQADLTVTFAGMKRGFLKPSAAEFTGDVVVSHIGIPATWVYDWVRQRRGASASDDGNGP